MAATPQQEVESLDRVLTRLATTEETNLEKVGKQRTLVHVSRFLGVQQRSPQHKHPAVWDSYS